MERVVGELQLDVLHVEQFGILFDESVFRLDQNFDQRSFVEIEKRRDHRQSADEFR